MHKLLTISEVAEILGISKSTAKTWASKRKLPVVKIGRLIRISPQSLDEYIKQNTEWIRGNREPHCREKFRAHNKCRSFNEYVEKIKDG